jgi:GTPase
MIRCGRIRIMTCDACLACYVQAARVVAMDKERLRSGDRACVRFRFLQRPEYITPGTRFVFREGRTKGIGMVVTTEANGFKLEG